MKRIAFVVYRRWAGEIAKNIIPFQKENSNFLVSAIITTPSSELKTEEFKDIFIVEGNDNEKINLILEKNRIDVIFYYGWSWIVKEPILSKYICLCLHPSPLPKYRGGTPIQHQIINGESESAVSVFKMKEGIDDGDIYKQLPMSLSGTLTDIFGRITDLGTKITKQFVLDLINNQVVFVPQKFLEDNLPLKRRIEKDSEILLSKAISLSYNEFYNRVRALTDPYPNAFILFSSAKLLIQEVEKYEIVPKNSVILNQGIMENIKDNKKPLYLRLSDSFAFVKKYRVE